MTTAPRRVRLQGITVVVAVFLAGGVLGAVAERYRAAHTEGAAPSGRNEGRRGGRDGLPRAFERIGLTEEQRGEIRAIFERRRPRTDAVMEDVLPRLRALRDSVEAEIDRVLTPEQREQLKAEFGDRIPRDGFRGGPRRGRDRDRPRSDSAGGNR